VDFAGLLFQTAELLRKDLSEEEAFAHVLVDDYQDTTQAAEAILVALSGAADSIVVAADPPGNVFAFRGGSLEPFERVDAVFPGIERVTLDAVYRRGITPEAIARLDHGDPVEGRLESGLEIHTFDHPGEEADFAANELLRARVEDGVGWEDMAIVVRRYGEYLTSLRHALARHDIPFVVVAEASAVATEPANRPVIDLFRYVLRPESREGLIEGVLLSPVVGLDPHQLRRLRREARLRGRTAAELVHAPDVSQLEPDLRGPIGSFAALVSDLESAKERPADELFAEIWSRLDWFRELVEREDRPRDVDALAALSDVLGRFVERRPGATMPDYLQTLDAAEFGPDPWIPPEERRPHAVRIVSAHRAHGIEFDEVVVVGCLEGEFPSLAHGAALVDLETVVSPTTPSERHRQRIATERALFRLAVSRARRKTVLTASRSSSARNPRTPSRFLARVGLGPAPAAEPIGPATSLLTLEASLRAIVADPAAPSAGRLAALAALPAAGATPGEWWGGLDWSEPGQPLHPGEIRTSYSRLSTLENCALQYLYSSEMGLDGMDRSHSMWLGSLVHDIIDRVQSGKLERSLQAMTDALEAAWQPEAFPNRALERQRLLDARKMLRQWLADQTTGESIASEIGFQFPLDGAVIRGRIDAVFPVGENGVRVLDYKTSKSHPTQDQVRRSLQLAAYYLAMRRVPELAELGEPRVLELAFLFLEGQDGGYKHMSTTPDRAPDGSDIREYEEWAESTILELLALIRAEKFAPNPLADCMWCSFKTICPVWPQGAEVGS
jgi:ATP-dependent exoDNAse (exonuclease V) beta subunit